MRENRTSFYLFFLKIKFGSHCVAFQTKYKDVKFINQNIIDGKLSQLFKNAIQNML